MALVPMDTQKVAACRALAAEVADDVQRYIDTHTSVGVERTIVRAYGVEGVDDQGIPLVNALVDRIHAAGGLGHGASYYLGRELARGVRSVQEAAERLAFAPEVDFTADEPPTTAKTALAEATLAG